MKKEAAVRKTSVGGQALIEGIMMNGPKGAAMSVRGKVVETPKLDRAEAKNEEKKSPDELLKRAEVIKDPNAPKFLEMYKESTNTKVIYQFNEDGTHSGKALSSDGAEAVFTESSREAKAKKRLKKKESKKAAKAQKKAEKKRLKHDGKEKDITSPEEIASLRAQKAKAAQADAKQTDSEKEAYARAAKKAELEAKAAREEAERLRAELEEMKAAAAKALEKRQAEADSFRPYEEEEKSDINGAE